MIYGRQSSQVTQQRWAALLRELDLPAPFTLDGFRSCLQQRCERTVRLMHTAMPPGAPSGVWLRSGSTDFLFIEEQTSPFHQAHVVAYLAAQILLDETPDGWIDGRLIPNVDPRPARMIPGARIGGPVSPSQAEAFAFQILRHAGLVPGSLRVQRSLRRLRPLHTALVAAVPAVAARTAAPGMARDPSSRLYRVVIQIRDAALALRPPEKPDAVTNVTSNAPLYGVDRQNLPIATNLAHFVSALLREAGGRSPKNQSRATCSLRVPCPDLRAETDHLVKASEAFTRSALRRSRTAGTPVTILLKKITLLRRT